MRKICFLLLLVIIVAFSFTSCLKKTTEPDNDLPLAPSPVISPAGGTFTTPQSVSISCDLSGSEIRYTIDGSDPNSTSLLYTRPIMIKTTQLIKAIALHEGYKQSVVDSASFTMNFIIPENMVFIQGGTFCPNSGSYIVTLTSFLIGKYELTQSEWKSVMTGNTNGIPVTPYGNPGYPGLGDDFPMYYVSWYDALVYCNRRSIQEGLTPCYAKDGDTNPDHWGFVPTQTNIYWDAITMNINADGYRLPTEMEWEFAARGGNQSQNYIYSGSFNIWEVAWFTYNSNNTTHKIGTKIPNEQGLYDMSGNVWEWCWDWYDPYPIGSYINPTGPGGGNLRIGRGGGWSAQAQYCQISNRPISYPFCRDNSIGFRVVRRIQ